MTDEILFEEIRKRYEAATGDTYVLFVEKEGREPGLAMFGEVDSLFAAMAMIFDKIDIGVNTESKLKAFANVIRAANGLPRPESVKGDDFVNKAAFDETVVDMVLAKKLDLKEVQSLFNFCKELRTRLFGE